MIATKAFLLLAVLCLSLADEKKDEPPAKKELFANEGFYKEQKGKEQEFTGVLRYKPSTGIGIGRYNPFTLEMEVKGKKEVREVYIGGKDGLIKAYAGKRVKITGKPVEMEVIGKIHREIWPARIELAEKKGAATDPPAEVHKPRILATARAWQLFAAARRGQQQVVITTPAQLLEAMKRPAGKEDEALRAAADAFRVKEVDLARQSIVVIGAGTQRSGGYSVEVTEVAVKDGQTTVKWKLNRPRPGQPVTLALTNPGVAVLIDKVAGKVVFEPAR